MTNKLMDLIQQKQDLHPELTPFIEDVGTIGPCLRHPLLYSLFYNPCMNAMLNYQYAEKKRLIEKALSDNDFNQYIWLHERPYRLSKFAEIQDLFDDKTYWKILGDIWSDSENLWQFGKQLELFIDSNRSNRSAMMNEDEINFLDKLPDQFTVYRGHQGFNKRGYSWTLSFWTAKWFAQRFNQSKPGVIKATINKKDVIASILGRNEYEIVALPKNLKDIDSVKKTKRPIWLESLFKEFSSIKFLKNHSIHGPWHWEKVEINALELAKHTQNADSKVAHVFALIHDTKRINENHDPEHGHRSAEYAQFLWKQDKLNLTKHQLDVLVEACRYHNDGQTTNDPTIGVCWDADRLDLIRVGIMPNPKYLSTLAAKELLLKI